MPLTWTNTVCDLSHLDSVLWDGAGQDTGGWFEPRLDDHVAAIRIASASSRCSVGDFGTRAVVATISGWVSAEDM